MKVIFACSGNTCRSPMAQAYFNYMAQREGKNMHASSAGVSAIDGDSVSLNSLYALKELFDIDISDHKAKKLNSNDVKNADVVLVMTKTHKLILTSLLPEYEEKIHLLSDYALGKNSGIEIFDPYGQDIEKYKKTALQIAKYIDMIISKN